MKLLANIVWLVTGGWLIGLVYLLGAIVFFPLLPVLYGLIGYGFWPFGRRAISRSRLEEFSELSGKPETSLASGAKAVGFLANVLWAITFGWLLALAHIIGSLMNLALFWLVITIPNIVGHWKLIPTAFAPFRKVVVSSTLADEIESQLEKKRLGL
jgi:uncharacterized membrane protein YccF (DUF307 family)